MKRFKILALAFICILIAPQLVSAGDFDGSKTLTCALFDVVECTPDGDIEKLTPEEVNLPRFFVIDFKKKKFSPAKASQSKRTSKIKHVTHIQGKLILQGADSGIENVRDGLGWSIAISEETGKMVITASGDDVGFVVFGACTPQ
jgi:hypothetical protein